MFKYIIFKLSIFILLILQEDNMVWNVTVWSVVQEGLEMQFTILETFPNKIFTLFMPY